jgi:hypothetical protein
MLVRVQRIPREPLAEVFVDFAHIPLRETDGSVSGVFVHGVDITEQVLARRRIERLAQEAQRSAGELEQRVQERTADLSRTVEILEQEVIRRTLADKALRERSEQLRALASESSPWPSDASGSGWRRCSTAVSSSFWSGRDTGWRYWSGPMTRLHGSWPWRSVT